MSIDVSTNRPTGEDRAPRIGEDVTGGGAGQVIACTYDNSSTLTVPRWRCVVAYGDSHAPNRYGTVRVWHAATLGGAGMVGWAWDDLRAHRYLADAASVFAEHEGGSA